MYRSTATASWPRSRQPAAPTGCWRRAARWTCQAGLSCHSCHCCERVCAAQGLAQYGNGFLAKFEAASCPNRLLEEISLVDTPGVLSGEKQRIERTYNFIDVCGWFAARCDLILLLFDPHKLDVRRPRKSRARTCGSRD